MASSKYYFDELIISVQPNLRYILCYNKTGSSKFWRLFDESIGDHLFILSRCRNVKKYPIVSCLMTLL